MQNHLLQILALIAMEQPISLSKEGFFFFIYSLNLRYFGRKSKSIEKV
jgi:hypothetical protein